MVKVEIGENTISMYEHSKPSQTVLYTDSEFFEGRVIITADHEKIVITKPTIDHKGKSYKCAYRSKTRRYTTTVTFPYQFEGLEYEEEESDEDKITLYYA